MSEEDFKRAIKNVASTPEGLRFIGHIIARSVGFAEAFNGNSKDAYNKGRSESGFELLEALRIYDFDSYIALLKAEKTERENYVNKKNKNKKRKDENDD